MSAGTVRSHVLLFFITNSFLLQLTSPMNIIKMQQQSIDLMRRHQTVMEEGLQQLLITPRDVEHAAQQHEQGGSAARELMKFGQEVI